MEVIGDCMKGSVNPNHINENVVVLIRLGCTTAQEAKDR